MRKVLRFYDNIEQVSGSLYENIVNEWDDHRLQVREKYINWLFPIPTDEDTKMVPGLRYKFQTNSDLRNKVFKAVERYISFLGYDIVYDSTEESKEKQPIDVKKSKTLNRTEKGITIGIYNKDTYPNISRIFSFLNNIRLYDAMALLFLAISKSMENGDLNHILTSKVEYYTEWKRYMIDNVENIKNKILKQNVNSVINKIITDAWD